MATSADRIELTSPAQVDISGLDVGQLVELARDCLRLVDDRLKAIERRDGWVDE